MLTVPGVMVEGRIGPVVTITGPIAVARALAASPDVSSVRLPWRPEVPYGSPLHAPPIDWLVPADGMELVGLTGDGALYWSKVLPGSGRHDGTESVATVSATDPPDYRVAALIGPAKLAAVTAANRLVWLRMFDAKPVPYAPPRHLATPARAVAVLARPPAGEVVIPFEDGTAARVPYPA